MTQKETEMQNFIDKITEIKNTNYEDFMRIKCVVDGVILANKNANRNCKKNVCGS